MTKAVKVAAVTAALVSIGAMTANATITSLGGSDDPYSVKFGASVTDDGVQGAVASSGPSWNVVVGYLSIPQVTGVVYVFGQHLDNPCGPPELAPNPNVFNASWLIPGTYGYQDYTATLSHPEIPGHVDLWTAKLTLVPPPSPVAPTFEVNVTGQHIPEPHQYALMAGLGLLAFGAYRRTRA